MGARMSRPHRRSRRVALAAAILLLALVALYAYATRPAALRARLGALLARYDLRVHSIDRIRYVPWDGLTFSGARIDVSQVVSDAPVAAAREAPDLLVWSVGHGKVRLPLGEALTGGFAPGAIDLRDVSIGLLVLADPEDALDEPLDASWLNLELPDPRRLPPVQVRNAHIRLYAPAGNGLRLQRRLRMDLLGEPARLAELGVEAYRVRIRQTGGPQFGHPEAPGDDVATASWSADSLELRTTWLGLDELDPWLPPGWLDPLRDVVIAGKLRAAVLHGARASRVELSFRDAHVAVPIEPRDRIDRADRFLQVDSAEGRLNWARVTPTGGQAASSTVALDLSGRVRGATVQIGLELDGLRTGAAEPGALQLGALAAPRYAARFSAEGIELPTATDYPAFVEAELLSPPIRNVFRKYDPSGRVDFELQVARGLRDAPPDETRFDGFLRARGGGCRYVLFPYAMHDAAGFVRFSNDGVVLDNMTGRHGSARVTVNGRLNNTTRFTGFELTVRGERVPLDDDLYAALPPEYQALWRKAAPIGLADIVAVIRRDDGSPELGELKPQVEIDTHLLAGSVRFDDRRLTHAGGRLHIADGRVALHDLHGFVEDAEVRARGQIASPADGPHASDIVIEAGGMQLARAEPTAADQSAAVLRFAGRGDVWGRLRRGGDASRESYVARIRDGLLIGFDPTQSWRVSAGWVSRGPLEQEIIGLTATRGASRLELSGRMPSTPDPHRPMDLRLHADQADVAALLKTLVPPNWTSIRQALGLAGQGDVSVRFERRPEPPTVRQSAEIELRAERMRPAPVPLDLHGVAARLEVRDDGFELFSAEADYGPGGRLSLRGAGGWSGQTWTRFGIQADNVELSENFIDAMPGPLARILRRLSAAGRISTQLDRLRLERQGPGDWDISGHIRLADAALNLGLRLESFEGELSGACQVRPGDGLTLDGRFGIERGVLAERPIRQWEGAIQIREAPYVQLSDVHGQICGGQVVGEARINAETGAYELAVTLQELDFAALVARDNPAKAAGAPGGAVSGHIFLRGQGGDLRTRQGGGELRIVGASLLSHRVTASVAQAGQRPRGSDRIQTAELRFAWDGHLLRFNRVDLHLRDMRLVGEGSWDTASDRISFTLIGASPEDATRIFPLTDLLELAGKELVQYRVTGTASDPKTQVEPLHNLTAAVREMLEAR